MPEFASNFEMRKQGFVYEAGDMASASMQDIPNNRTLFVGDLSGKPATKPELNYELETLEDVFAHYKPEVKVEYEDEDGRSITETLEFRSVADFTKKAYVEKSSFLNTLQQSQKDHIEMARRLQNNKMLQKVLSDPQKKAAYLAAIKNLLNELGG